MRRLTALAAASMPRGAFHPLFSPDGALLRYQEDIETAISPKRAHETCIWDVTRQCVVRRFRGQEASWSADSQRLTFVSDGKVYVAGRDGSDAKPVGEGAGPRWHLDGTTLYWTKKVDGQAWLMHTNVEAMTVPEQIVEVAPGQPWALSLNRRWLAYLHTEPNPKRLKGLPQSAVQIGSFPDILEVRVIDLTNGRVYMGGKLPPGTEVSSLNWSADNRTLAYDWQLFWESPGPFQRHISLWQPGEGKPVAVDLGEAVLTSRPSWSPDGSRLALLANPWGRFTTDPFGWLTVFDINEKTICWQCYDVLVTAAAIWSPDGDKLYCRSARHTEQPYVAFSVEGELLRKVTPEGHYCSAAALSSDGKKLAVSARSFSGLNEIWLCPTGDGAPACITVASQILDDLPLSRVWTHQWVTPDGLTLDGIVIEPGGIRSQEAPILVVPDADQRGWNIVDLEPDPNCGFLLHWMAQRGYRVFIPSNRLTGLAGLKHLADHWRPSGAACDIATGIESLRKRLGTKAPVVAFGQSIGGDLTCEILVSYPNLLAAAVVSGIQPDFATLYSIEATPNPTLRETFGGPPWEHPREYLEASPIRGVAQVRCPILIMMGSEDTSWPNAERFYVALSEAGKDVTYLLFQNQGHWPKEPEKVATYVRTAIEWLTEKIASAQEKKP